jgi:hypothetical protein
MAIEKIHSYMLRPRKGTTEDRDIGGTAVPLEGRLFELLNDIYSSDECDIAISFNPAADGTQHNQCRELIVEYLNGPTLARGRRLADRLEKVTDHRSGMGLLFLIAGREGREHKIVLSRFPADSAILAEENERELSVEFLERVFMKSATAYKAATYQDASITHGFWVGRATDKQINARITQISNYWIADFLASDFKTTAAAGTRRLAIALREAAKNSTDVGVKSEIAAAVTLARGLAGRRLSAREFAEHFQLSGAARKALQSEIKSDALADERFQFDVGEFVEHVPYRSVELDNGAVLTADSGEFPVIFQREVIESDRNRVRFSTEGSIVNEKFGRTR